MLNCTQVIKEAQLGVRLQQHPNLIRLFGVLEIPELGLRCDLPASSVAQLCPRILLGSPVPLSDLTGGFAVRPTQPRPRAGRGRLAPGAAERHRHTPAAALGAASAVDARDSPGAEVRGRELCTAPFCSLGRRHADRPYTGWRLAPKACSLHCTPLCITIGLTGMAWVRLVVQYPARADSAGGERIPDSKDSLAACALFVPCTAKHCSYWQMMPYMAPTVFLRCGAYRLYRCIPVAAGEGERCVPYREWFDTAAPLQVLHRDLKAANVLLRCHALPSHPPHACRHM
jgi:hypothetical protein